MIEKQNSTSSHYRINKIGVQPQLYIMLAPNKIFLVKERTIATVILIEIEVIVEQPFKLFQFFFDVFPYGLCSIGLLRLDFVNGIVVNEF